MSDPCVWLAVRGTWMRGSWLPVKNYDSPASIQALLVEAVSRGAVVVECSSPSRWVTQCAEWSLLRMTDEASAAYSAEVAALEKERSDERERKRLREFAIARSKQGKADAKRRRERRHRVACLEDYWTRQDAPDPTREIAARVLVGKIADEARRLDLKRSKFGKEPIYTGALVSVALGEPTETDRSRAHYVASRVMTSGVIRGLA